MEKLLVKWAPDPAVVMKRESIPDNIDNIGWLWFIVKQGNIILGPDSI